MALIHQNQIDAVRTVFYANFEEAVNGTQQGDIHKDGIATTIPSSGAFSTYGWLASMPAFREWVGDRLVNDVREREYIIENKKFESTVAISRDDIEDGNLGHLSTLSTGLVEEAFGFLEQGVFDLLNEGNTRNCYDGKTFFSAEHPVNASHDGKGADTLVSNDLGGSEVSWYLLDCSRSLRPLIVQERRKVEIDQQTTPDSDHTFMSDEYRFGASWRGAFAYGLWQMAVKCSESLDASSFQRARTQMMQFTRDGGQPIRVKPTHLIVPPSLEKEALNLVRARETGGGDNAYAGSVQVIVSPYING